MAVRNTHHTLTHYLMTTPDYSTGEGQKALFYESHETVFSKLRPTSSGRNPFKVGDKVNYKDLNLRHPSCVMEVVALCGSDSVKVKHPSGVVGEWLCRDLIPHVY